MSTSSGCPKTPPLKLGRPPARASEGFLSTIAQGMWAEEVFRNALNEVPGLKAIKYGPSRWNHELIGSKEAWQRYVHNLYLSLIHI